MGLALDYASDASDDDTPQSAPSAPSPAPSAPAPSSALNLPPPRNRKRPLKIGFDHPLLSAPRLSSEPTAAPLSDHDDEHPQRTAKKQRTADAPSETRKGKGKSTLLDMLPPPKRALPSARPTAVKPTAAPRPPPTDTLVAPPSPPTEPAELDLFGLATPSASVPPPQTTPASPATTTLSSAPAITEYTPPAPTAQDPYPGYYLLPSGEWAAYDPTYYAQFFPAAAAAASEQLVEQGAMGRGWSDVQSEQDQAVHVDARKGLEQARKEQDELKRLTAPALYAEENTYKAVGKTLGKAGQRHQLSALLKDAHANRQALEERIAQNKRTKKESGGRYGF